jgi:hypothetical protein
MLTNVHFSREYVLDIFVKYCTVNIIMKSSILYENAFGEILGFYSDGCEDGCLLGCFAMWCGIN